MRAARIKPAVRRSPVIDWPSELVKDLARRRCVVFLGSGISAQARNKNGEAPKMWRPFLEHALLQIKNPQLQKQVTSLLNKNDYLTACQVVKDNMGDRFHDLVKEQFHRPDFKPVKIHRVISSLEASIVATPNYDKVYEHEASTATVKNYYDDDVAEVIRSVSPAILKIHGTVDKPNQMIFTRQEYARARSEYRDFYAIIEALAITHTFLFFGCGLEDPDIRLVLEDYAFRHHYGRPHFFILPRNHVQKHVHPAVEKSLNVRLLYYDKIGDHRLLVEAIDELSTQVGLARSVLAKEQSW